MFSTLKYTLRKLLELLPKLLVISLVLFLALELLPGDPLTRAMNPEAYKQLTDFQKEQYRESMGLNDPWPVRYVNWIWNILHGDFGYSTSTGFNIGTMLATRMPFTIELAFWGLMVANVFGIVFGYFAAIKKRSIIDYSCSIFSTIGISVPEFFFGIMFILFFALKLDWFPTGGRMPVGEHTFWDRIPYLILPALTMGINLTGALSSFTRTSMLDVLNKDYIKTAQSKGLSETTVNIKHGFRNALIPIVTTICLRIPMLVGGSAIIETVFNYPAIGTMAIDALNAKDIPVVMVTTMACAVMVLVASTLVDILTALLDPRVRLE